MIRLDADHWSSLARLLGDERCCSLHAQHVSLSGHGAIWVDRWPEPSAALAFTGGNMGCWGDPGRVDPEALGSILRELLDDWERVFIDPAESFAPLLRDALPGLFLWPRVLYALPGAPAPTPAPVEATLRTIGPDDARALGRLDESIEWIADTHDGPDGLARSGRAVGAWVDGRLVAVSAVFYRGNDYEELGVVTEPDQRGRGLSAACSAALIDDILARGHRACWSTTPDNTASMRVAEKLGFVHEADQQHYMAGEPVTGALPLD